MNQTLLCIIVLSQTMGCFCFPRLQRRSGPPTERFERFNIIENKLIPTDFGGFSGWDRKYDRRNVQDGQTRYKNLQDFITSEELEKRAGKSEPFEFYPLNKLRVGRDVDHVDPTHNDE